MTFAHQQLDSLRKSRGNNLQKSHLNLDDSGVSAYGGSLTTFPRESDFIKYDDQVMGSTEQRRFKVNEITGGAMSSPGNSRRSCDTFYSTYLNQMTHGVASGQDTEARKNVRNKIAGGSMTGVL